MRWITGALGFDPEDTSSNPRLCLPRQDGFRCGEPLEIKLDGEWRRGRVELDGRGWYWTDNKTRVGMYTGTEARVWDGRDWPRVERGGQDRVSPLYPTR